MSKNKILIIISAVIVFILITIFTAGYVADKKAGYKIISNLANEGKIVVDLDDENKLDENKPTIVVFSSERCMYCLRFLPTLKKIVKDYGDKFNFMVLDYDDPKNSPLVRTNVSELPCMYIFDVSIGNKIHMPAPVLGYETVLRYELDKYLRIRSCLDMEKAKKLHEEYLKKVTVKEKK